GVSRLAPQGHSVGGAAWAVASGEIRSGHQCDRHSVGSLHHTDSEHPRRDASGKDDRGTHGSAQRVVSRGRATSIPRSGVDGEMSGQRLTIDGLRDLVGRGLVETVIVGFTDHYGRLLGKRCEAEMFVNETTAHGTHGCNYPLTTDMAMRPGPGSRHATTQTGYTR